MIQLRTILIIDNDPATIFLQKRQIEKVNLATEVYTASNGEEAIDFLVNYYRNNEALPEVILSAINMPCMDGVEFVKRLKKLPFYKADSVILAMVSSTEDIDIIQKIKEEGVKYYFQKPLIEDYIKFLRAVKLSRLGSSLAEKVFGKKYFIPAK
jgi:CheY-like chemotaxis protein